MKPTPFNTFVFKNLHDLYNRISNSKIFNIQRRRLIFKPEKNTSVHFKDDNDMSIDHEIHHHRPNTRPVAEKQTLIKEKGKNGVKTD